MIFYFFYYCQSIIKILPSFIRKTNNKIRGYSYIIYTLFKFIYLFYIFFILVLIFL